MEYIEFFFGSFWHWFGLWVIIATIFGTPIISIINKNKNKEND